MRYVDSYYFKCKQLRVLWLRFKCEFCKELEKAGFIKFMDWLEDKIERVEKYIKQLIKNI